VKSPQFTTRRGSSVFDRKEEVREGAQLITLNEKGRVVRGGRKGTQGDCGGEKREGEALLFYAFPFWKRKKRKRGVKRKKKRRETRG